MNMYSKSFADALRARKFPREEFIASQHGDLIGTVREIAGTYYKGVKDKGDDTHSSTIWTHIRRVEMRMHEFLGDNVSENTRVYFEALAIGHELFDLKTPDKKESLLTRDMLRAYGLPNEFIDDLYAMGVKPAQLYLDYAQALSLRTAPALCKLVADLPENTSASRKPLPEHLKTQKLRDKKQYLYELAGHYLQAVLTGRVQPGISPVQFAMQDRYVPQNLKNIDVLRRHSSDQTHYQMVPTAGAFERVFRYSWPLAGQPRNAI